MKGYRALLLNNVELLDSGFVFRVLFPCTRHGRVSTTGTSSGEARTRCTGPSTVFRGRKWTSWTASQTTTTGPSGITLLNIEILYI